MPWLPSRNRSLIGVPLGKFFMRAEHWDQGKGGDYWNSLTYFVRQKFVLLKLRRNNRGLIYIATWITRHLLIPFIRRSIHSVLTVRAFDGYCAAKPTGITSNLVIRFSRRSIHSVGTGRAFDGYCAIKPTLCTCQWHYLETNGKGTRPHSATTLHE